MDFRTMTSVSKSEVTLTEEEIYDCFNNLYFYNNYNTFTSYLQKIRPTTRESIVCYTQDQVVIKDKDGKTYSGIILESTEGEPEEYNSKVVIQIPPADRRTFVEFSDKRYHKTFYKSNINIKLSSNYSVVYTEYFENCFKKWKTENRDKLKEEYETDEKNRYQEGFISSTLSTLRSMSMGFRNGGKRKTKRTKKNRKRRRTYRKI
jgi:hypothetical protein